MAMIAELTPRQCEFLYYRPRKEDGSPKPIPYPFEKPVEFLKDDFMRMGRDLGMSEDALLEEWEKSYGSTGR